MIYGRFNRSANQAYFLHKYILSSLKYWNLQFNDMLTGINDFYLFDLLSIYCLVLIDEFIVNYLKFVSLINLINLTKQYFANNWNVR